MHYKSGQKFLQGSRFKGPQTRGNTRIKCLPEVVTKEQNRIPVTHLCKGLTVCNDQCGVGICFSPGINRVYA